MKTLGIVTLFHPPVTLAENLLSYAGSLDGLVLWDNTPGGARLDLPESVLRKVVKRRKGRNVGIGEALNVAAALALKEDYTHLLTMDQDSRFAGASFRDYVKAISADADESNLAYVPRVNRAADRLAMPVAVKGMIVSGTVFRVSAFRCAGMFRADFVIDTIDTEYALRIHRQGGKIMEMPSGSLVHALGKPLRRRFLCFHPVSLNYSPLRTYYMTRNLLYLDRTAKDFHRPDLLWRLVWKRPFYILLMEPCKVAKLKAWARGVWQGLNRKLTPDCYQDCL